MHCSWPAVACWAKPEGKWQARLDSAGEVREFNNAEAGMKLEGPLLASPLSVQNEGSETLYQQLTLSGYPRQGTCGRRRTVCRFVVSTWA